MNAGKLLTFLPVHIRLMQLTQCKCCAICKQVGYCPRSIRCPYHGRASFFLFLAFAEEGCDSCGIEVEFIRSFPAASFSQRSGWYRAGISAWQAGIRVLWAFSATFCQKLHPMWLTRRAFSQALPGADFRASSCAAPTASVFRGGYRHDAQSTRVTGQACRKRPIYAGYRACSPPRAIICRALGCAATWRGVRKFAAAMRPIYPSPAHRLTLHFTRPSYSPHAGRADCACQSPRVCHWGLASMPPCHRSPRI